MAPLATHKACSELKASVLKRENLKNLLVWCCHIRFSAKESHRPWKSSATAARGVSTSTPGAANPQHLARATTASLHWRVQAVHCLILCAAMRHVRFRRATPQSNLQTSNEAKSPTKEKTERLEDLCHCSSQSIAHSPAQHSMAVAAEAGAFWIDLSHACLRWCVSRRAPTGTSGRQRMRQWCRVRRVITPRQQRRRRPGGGTWWAPRWCPHRRRGSPRRSCGSGTVRR